jgi:hypothetical protein
MVETMTRKLAVRTDLIRKDYKSANEKQQLKVLAKLGYESPKRFTEIKRFEIKLLKNNVIYTVSDKEYQDIQNKITDEGYRLYGVKQTIKKLILQALKNDEEITPATLFRRLYQLENENEVKQKVAGWNDFLAQWRIEVNKDEIEDLEKEIDTIQEEQGFVTDEDIGEIAAGLQLSKAIEKEQKRIKKLDYNTRYKNGHFDRHNIFDVFGYLWSENPLNGDPYVPKSYQSLILVLNDYRFNGSPSQATRDFNSKWIDGFFTYLVQMAIPM